MLLVDDLSLLFSRRERLTYPDFLRQYVRFAGFLMYMSEADIREVTSWLVDQIMAHARRWSPIYKQHEGIISKDDLMDKDRWYVPGYQAAAASTRGSTTGEPFRYLRWHELYQEIEGENHYKAVLHEFGMDDRPINVLYMMLNSGSRHDVTMVRTYTTSNVLISHGMRQQATVHEVIRNSLYYTDYREFYENIIHYTRDHDIDVILAPGNVIAALTWNVRRLRHSAPLCRLLSNTGAKVDRSDLDFLVHNGNIECWCDHMRCWDGGVTFYTCRYNTYHLMDGLAWCYADQDRLVSYDYFSLPAPFVNYWNGDYAHVGDSYHRCNCGRAYRDFSIRRTRTVETNHINSSVVRQVLLDLDLCRVVRRVETAGDFMRIFAVRSLTETERADLRRALPTFEVNVVTEEPHG